MTEAEVLFSWLCRTLLDAHPWRVLGPQAKLVNRDGMNSLLNIRLPNFAFARFNGINWTTSLVKVLTIATMTHYPYTADDIPTMPPQFSPIVEFVIEKHKFQFVTSLFATSRAGHVLLFAGSVAFARWILFFLAHFLAQFACPWPSHAIGEACDCLC